MIRGGFGVRFEARRWERAYARVVRASFDTVPFYRERWALVGREPVPVAELERRQADLFPLGSAGVAGPVADLPGVALSARESLPATAAAGTLLYDPLLGPLAAALLCGQWHVDWRRVYARSSTVGVAFTVLHQRSPRLVDAVPGGAGGVAMCPKHETPVLVP